MKALILLLLTSSALLAQEKPTRTLRILPLGDNPPFRQEVRDGARREIAPEAGSVPPPTVLLPTSKEDAPSRINLRLGSPSLPIKLPAGEEPGSLTLRNADGKAWASIPYTEKSATLTLIWRGGKTWNEIHSLPLSDGANAFDQDSARFVNLTTAPIGIVWGNQQKKLAPGKILTLSFDSDSVPLQVLYPTKDGNLRPCLQSVVEKSDLLRQQFFIYQSDGEDIRVPVKVYPLKENR